MNSTYFEYWSRRVGTALVFGVLSACALLQPPVDDSKPASTITEVNPPVVVAASAPSSSDTSAKPAAPAAPAPAAAVPTNPTNTSAEAGRRTAPPPIPDASRLYPGSGQFVRPPSAPVPSAKGPEEFTLNYESLDIRAVVQSILGDMLRESFSIHPQTTGNVTIRLSKPVPRGELIPTLEMLLRQNGQIMVKEDGIYKIMPAAVGTRGSVTPQVMTTPAQLPNGYSVQIVQLRFAGVRDMQRILEPYAVEPQSSIRIDELRNLVILSGTQRELKHMLEVIDIFDVDYLAGYSVGLFPMQTDVKALSADLDRIFGGGGTGAAAAPSPLAGIVRIVPIERLNGLLVITTQPRYLEEAKKWIDRLDKGGGLAGGTRLNVYPVQNGRADRLAQLLTDIYGNRQGGATGTGATLAPGARPATTTTPGTPAQPGGGGQVAQGGAFGAFLSNIFQSSGTAVSKDTRIIADDDNNALLILASPADYETILAALRQLDVPRRQVLVEVLVAEVTLTDELKFGIEWFINSRNNTVGALRNLGGDSSILPRVLPQTPGLGGALDPRGTYPGTSTTIVPSTPGLQLINLVGTDIRAVLQALGQDGRASVESAPKLLVLDNAKGTVNVGTRISVETGSSTGSGTGGNTVTTRQYIDTGVLLTVTPRINAGGRVTLDINQEVSSAGAASSNNPPINTRKAQTTVNVASGETMVLAGLIQKDRGSGTQGVPLLSKIPIIGGLFGTQTFRNNRTELVVLITPTVIASNDEVRGVTDELRKKLPSLEHLMQRKTEPTAK
ncbi:MAG: type II secretion system secretin GspD [Rhodocyclaceae bacterium]|nr:type II secretion system secretin GspD [Rhodocyclaceae bacterium]MCA3026730.1 type II secretion system secretin GspD [Rhodocyclaceae bacterium]MCA3029419.1 type II secretion system secretin GspD [Rhodocyclaceae bacterium]MCA3033005.1 type II secretion system secretin GspD [Rhodocyclaceae bacterium]MCA3034196.1 type II secretion system secretin GspD [Rhodocyclaceae bacterium]